MKKIFLVIATGFFAVTAFSQPQQQNRHEFSVWAGGGINSLQSSGLAADGKNSIGLGMLGGIGYNFFFDYHWSVGTGIEFSLLNGSLKYNSLSDMYGVSDGVDSYILDLKISDYEESHRAVYLNIPLMAKYQVDVFNQHKFYATAGLKIGIPLTGSFSWNNTYTTALYKIDLNDPVGWRLLNPEPIPGGADHGIGTFTESYSGDIDFKVNFMLSAEAGMKWKLGNTLDLYTGLYFDFGLNDIRKSTNDDLLAYTYNSGKFMGYEPHSLLSSSYHNGRIESSEVNGQIVHEYKGDVTGAKYIDKLSTLGFGLKVQLTFGYNPF